MPTVACGALRGPVCSSIGSCGRQPHARMQEAWFTSKSSEPDPFATLGVARSADRREIKRAYRLRARELHPDVCDHPASAERFRALVDAYQTVQTFAPGSIQTHPCWDQLSEYHQHWAEALGHSTVEGLEEWISALGLYEDEDLMLTNPLRASGGQMEAEPVSQADVTVTSEAPAQRDESTSRISAVLGYRVFLGSQQWRVRWAGDLTEETWERFGILDTEMHRREAQRLRTEEECPAGPE